MCRIAQMAAPELVFASVGAFLKHVPVIKPPAGFKLDHLTFVGRAKAKSDGGLFDVSHVKASGLKWTHPANFHLTYFVRDSRGPLTLHLPQHQTSQASELNRLGSRYEVDAYVLLVDVGQVVPDAPFALPCVHWLPYHFSKVRGRLIGPRNGIAAVFIQPLALVSSASRFRPFPMHRLCESSQSLVRVASVRVSVHAALPS
jgi:hypothetical protein